MATMTVEIVSAEAEIYSGTAKMFFAPAVMGEVGVMPRHTPLLTKIRPGEVRVINEDDEEEFFYVSGGMLEILPSGVTVLADTAQGAKDLDWPTRKTISIMPPPRLSWRKLLPKLRPFASSRKNSASKF